MKRLLILAAAGLLLAGCSNGSKAVKASSTTKAAVATTVKPKPVQHMTYPKESATAIAALIKGCVGVKTSPIGAGTKSGLASAATCTLAGRTVTVDSWTDSDESESVVYLIKADKLHAHFVGGVGFTALISENTTFQHQITNDAGWLLEHASDGQPVEDLPGEKAAAAEIAKQFVEATVVSA